MGDVAAVFFVCGGIVEAGQQSCLSFASIALQECWLMLFGGEIASSG